MPTRASRVFLMDEEMGAFSCEALSALNSQCRREETLFTAMVDALDPLSSTDLVTRGLIATQIHVEE